MHRAQFHIPLIVLLSVLLSRLARLRNDSRRCLPAFGQGGQFIDQDVGLCCHGHSHKQQYVTKG